MVNTISKPSGYLRAPQQGRVTIQDDSQRGIVTITMEDVQARDSGVYWCALYEQLHLFRMVEVTLSISNVSAGPTLTGSAGPNHSTPSGDSPAQSSAVNIFNLLSGVLSVLFILALITSITLCIRRRKQLKRRGPRQAEDIYDKPEDIAQPDSTERMESPSHDSTDLKYVTLNFKSQLSPEDPLYCNAEPNQTHRKPEEENVEYATIALKQLPMNDKR
ncbi:CMRF35-like molecule 1 [Phalacrocorax carbo]|uniref:CMRF35-like molecule 1 n=1 Tax=Phalacrocorax carbo TaxID=9209 RepID=UPI003119BD98